jgi:hypothetical protein
MRREAKLGDRGMALPRGGRERRLATKMLLDEMNNALHPEHHSVPAQLLGDLACLRACFDRA